MSAPVDLARVLITGGDGRVARALGFGLRVSRMELDVTQSALVAAAFERLRPSTVLHLASVPLSACEADPQRAWEVNVGGTHAIDRVPFRTLHPGLKRSASEALASMCPRLRPWEESLDEAFFRFTDGVRGS